MRSRSHASAFSGERGDARVAHFLHQLVGERDAEVGLDEQRLPVDLLPLPAAKAVDQRIPEGHGANYVRPPARCDEGGSMTRMGKRSFISPSSMISTWCAPGCVNCTPPKTLTLVVWLSSC